MLQDKISYKLKCEQQRERSEMLALENQQLKDKVGELEEEGKTHRKNVKGLQAQVS